MRMIDDERNVPVQKLWLYMTELEATQLLAGLQEGQGLRDQEWHAHVDSHHGEGVALTVAVYDPTNLPDDPMIAQFLSTGVWGA
jgi:hypothetical protein